MPLVRRTRATLRSAEFGFFGVVVYTRVQTPRRWGEPFNAGVLVFSTLSSRPLRTSWLIVGMGGLDLLPALGRALSMCVAARGAASGPGHDPPSGPRGRACHPPQDRPNDFGPESLAPRDSATSGDPGRTANGSRPRAPWARLTTIPGARRPVQTGSVTPRSVIDDAHRSGRRGCQRHARRRMFPTGVTTWMTVRHDRGTTFTLPGAGGSAGLVRGVTSGMTVVPATYCPCQEPHAAHGGARHG